LGIQEKVKYNAMLLTLSLIQALRGVRDNLRSVVWQPYALSLGLDMKSVGVLESILDLSKNLMEPAFGTISDSIGRKKLTVFREVLILLGTILVLFARDWHFLFIAVIFIGVSSAITSVWNAVIADSTEPSKLAYVYGVIGTFYTGAGLLGTLGAGLIADTFGYTWVYTIATVLSFFTLILVFFKLPETRSGITKPVNWRKATTAFIHALKPPKKLRRFYAVMALDLFAFSTGLRLLNGMLVKNYGYTPGMIGFYATAMTLTWAIAQIPMGRLADRFGYSRFMAISQFIACIMLGICIYSKTFEYIFIANLILGLANALWMPAEQAWIAANIDPDERAKAIASYSTFRGLLAIPAPIFGGWLFDSYGFDIPIAVNLILALLDGLLLLLVVKDKRSAEAL